MENKTIKELQDYVNNFVKERGWQTTESDILVHMIEELGEIARDILAMKNYGGQHTSEKNTDVHEELADLFYLLLKMSNECNVDLGKSFSDKMEKNAKRFPPK